MEDKRLKDVAELIPAMKKLVFPIITLYDHPKDYPDKVVARLWDGTSAQPTNIVLLFAGKEEAKQAFSAFNYLERSHSDDPSIICTYLP